MPQNIFNTDTHSNQLSPRKSSSSSESNSSMEEEDKSVEFSSLLYISKRLNKQNETEKVSNITRNYNNEFDEAKQFSINQEKLNTSQIDNFHGESIEEWIKYLASKTQELLYADFLEFNENQFKYISALKCLHKQVTGRPLIIDKNDNIYLQFDMDKDEDRELIVSLSKVKLPELYTLKIEHFYEADEDLENFLENSLKSLCHFMFLSESFWVDLHDYLERILQITSVKHLHLKGFMIDSDDNEKLFSSWKIEVITFESWNLSIEEDFSIRYKEYYQNRLWFPILSKIEFIDDETERESMESLIKAISNWKLSDSLKYISLSNCELSAKKVQQIAEKFKLNIQIV